MIIDKEQKLLDMLNAMIKICPMTYGEFNKQFPTTDINMLRKLEQEMPEFGIAKFNQPVEGVSTMSIIASITEVLCGKRLAIQLEEADSDFDDMTPEQHRHYYDAKKIIGFAFYSNDNK